jgi:hypothetical protein
MAIEITKEQQQVIDLAIASGAFQRPGEMIGTALDMLFEEIEDGIVSDAQADEQRFALGTDAPLSVRDLASLNLGYACW